MAAEVDAVRRQRRFRMRVRLPRARNRLPLREVDAVEAGVVAEVAAVVAAAET